ncbi:MAG TPA: cupin domain-containing protein [Xanthobacteraceae bacterium]|nr:cupin domain-containing protein [Xanthobacteraceae bacterium]
MKRPAAALIVAMAVWPAAARAEAPPAPPVTVTPLASATSTASGQPIGFPAGPGRVVVAEYVIAPGARLPVHRHPYPRIGYVLQGTLEVVEERTGRVFSYKPGDVIVEVIGAAHFGRNTGSDPVRLVVFDTTPADVEGNVTLEK